MLTVLPSLYLNVYRDKCIKVQFSLLEFRFADSDIKIKKRFRAPLPHLQSCDRTQLTAFVPMNMVSIREKNVQNWAKLRDNLSKNNLVSTTVYNKNDCKEPPKNNSQQQLEK